MEKANTIESLVDAAQTGDTKAFNELYRTYHMFIHGIVLARVAYGDADDLVQEVFTMAWRKRTELRSAGAFKAWLAQIARRACTRHLERRGRSAVSELPSELGTAPPEVADALGLLAAMRGLAEDYREILVLRFVEGLTGPEIADLLLMTHGSVRSKIHRGLDMLRAECVEKSET